MDIEQLERMKKKSHSFDDNQTERRRYLKNKIEIIFEIKFNGNYSEVKVLTLKLPLVVLAFLPSD